MFRVTIWFNNGSHLEYTSDDEVELNKIRHCLDRREPLYTAYDGRNLLIMPDNILFLEYKKQPTCREPR